MVSIKELLKNIVFGIAPMAVITVIASMLVLYPNVLGLLLVIGALVAITAMFGRLIRDALIK